MRATPSTPATAAWAGLALVVVAVLLLHGAGANRETMLGRARFLHEEGFTVLAGRCTDPPQQAYQPIAAAIEGLGLASPALLLRAGIDQECGQLARLAPSLASPPLALSVPPAADPAPTPFLHVEVVGSVKSGSVVARPPRRSFLAWLLRRPPTYAAR